MNDFSHDMTTNITIHLSLADRLRALFGATIYVSNRTWFARTVPPEDVPRVVRGESEVRLVTPWAMWWHRRHPISASIGGGHES